MAQVFCTAAAGSGARLTTTKPSVSFRMRGQGVVCFTVAAAGGVAVARVDHTSVEASRFYIASATANLHMVLSNVKQ